MSRTPRAAHRLRLSVLVLLFAVLSGHAQAACTAGSLDLELVSHSGGCGSTLLARCLPRVRVAIDVACALQLTPLAGGNAYVPAIWSTHAAGTYTRLLQCPTAASVAVATNSDPTEAQVKAAFETALEHHIYGSAHPITASSIVWNNGTVTVTTTSDSCQLKYAITAVTTANNSLVTKLSPHAVLAQCTEGGALAAGTECQLSLSTGCNPGRRPVQLTADTQACPLCDAGSYSASGTGCTACAAGKHGSSVGATSCTTDCVVGTYSPSTGYSECLPCLAGTYQSAAGQSGCSSCPAYSYARMPGATQCVKCVGGVARCTAGSGCSDDADAPSQGYQVLSITTPNQLPTATCNLSAALSFGNPPLFGQCTLAASPATQLSIFVDRYCAVSIWPIGDTACAKPSESYWSSMRIRGFYVSPTKIATSLGTDSSSYLLTLEKANASTLSLTYWPATTNKSVAATVTAEASQSCQGTLEVEGGQVGEVPASPEPCPTGSYDSASHVDGCRPCPVGAYCGSNATTPSYCDAGTYQPYVGQTSVSACVTCPAPTNFTSYAGSDSCEVPVIPACANGTEYDSTTAKCVGCPAGTKRDANSEDVCVPCPPGHYSGQNASSCTPCPADQFSPIYGLAEQDSGGVKKCWYCSNGTVAVTAAKAVGQTGSTACSACPPGTISAVEGANSHKTCAACLDGYYRPGWASATSNTCIKIPNGYKESSRASTTYDRAQIEHCSKGEVSSWSGETRTPADSEACSPCTANTHAPRRGMSACQACTGGTAPIKSLGSLPGFDTCTPCTGITYRPYSSSSSTCLECTAGKEAHPTGHRACIPCIAGWYMPDSSNGTNLTAPALTGTCMRCPVNSFQNQTGQASCTLCPAGSSTSSEGNSQCYPCPLGHYSPSEATECVAAPSGSFVNYTGATTYTPCPRGRFSSSSGAESCDICMAGRYANALGSKACKICPAGTWSSAASASCTKCLAGYYSSAGSGVCVPCKPSWFASSSGMGSCQRCPKGRQCPTLANRVPQLCPRGSYSSREGARLCTPCPSNTYQNLTGQQGCKPCASGYSTRGLVGQSTCQLMRFSPTARKLLRSEA